MTLVTPPFHVGAVVADLTTGMEEITQALGISWGRVQRRELSLEAPGGPRPVDVAYAYSLGGPPYLELIEQRPDSVFAQLGLHHIGVWTQDPHGESQRLDAMGWPRETVIIGPDGQWGGGLFHTGTSDLRVEIVDIVRSGPRLVNYLGGGDYSLPPDPS
jgi:hypothetical protein